MTRLVQITLDGGSVERLAGPLRDALPEFVWRRGDSDAQGPYLKGYHPNGLDVAFWFGEPPAVMTLDGRHVEGDATGLMNSLERRLEDLLNQLEVKVLHRPSRAL